MQTMPEHTLARWLQRHCDSCPLIDAGLVVGGGAGPAAFEPLAQWPAASPAHLLLATAAQAALKRTGRVTISAQGSEADTQRARIIAMPIGPAEAALGGVALSVRAHDAQALEAVFENLARACAELPALMSADRPPQADCLFGLQATLLRHPSLAEGALVMANELATLLDSERVTLGLLSDRRVELIALSGSDGFDAAHESLRLVAAAMEEAIDQDAAVVYPVGAGQPLRVVLAHAELHARTGRAMATVPLVDQGLAVGALHVECRGTAGLAAAQLALCTRLAELIGPLVALRRRAERSLATRCTQALRGLARRLTQRGDPVPKVAAAGVVALVMGAAFVTTPYRITAPVRIEGAVQRAVAAPVDGFLHRAHVRPGDLVRAGDVLIELSDRDLQLEMHKWESALAQHENGFAAALARADRSEFVINQGKAGEARSQLELVRAQLARTRLLAPIDGVVIKGDLSQALGAPVQRGEALLTLAPDGQYRVMLDVDERDVGLLQPGQRGQLALSALPGDLLPLVVERITPVAAVREGRNAFEVQAALQGDTSQLRPGLQGLAKIEVGRRSLAWVAGHRVVERLRLWLWAWGLG